MPDHDRHTFDASVFISVANVVYVLLAVSLLTLAGCMPLILTLLFVSGTLLYPIALLGVVLSVPAIAAAFAMFRSHRIFLSSVRRKALSAFEGHGRELPAWIAPPYVHQDADAAIIRPYLRSYRRLFVPALAIALVCASIEFLIALDARLLLQLRWGVLLLPLFVFLAVLIVESGLVALALRVEFPKATWKALVRNACVIPIRRFLPTVGNVLFMVAYMWSAHQLPVLSLVLGTGPLLLVLWAGVRWQIQPLALKMAEESNDAFVIALYA
jgi:uncharacterized membrane protein YesL